MIPRSTHFEWCLHTLLAAIVIVFSLWVARGSNLSLLWLPVVKSQAVTPLLRATAPVIDATGTSTFRGEYHRLVVLDGLDIVLSLVPESRIVGVDEWSVTHSIEGWRVRDRPKIGDRREIELILACHPDLVISCTNGDPTNCDAVAQIRALGIPVFDLGYVRTFDDLMARVQSLGALFQLPDRAAKLQQQLRQRMALTRSPPRPAGPSKRALFLCAAGDGFTVAGGDDVFQSMLLLAGLRNAAAEAGINAMPIVTQETPLKLDPQVLVVRPRNRRAIDNSAPLKKLRIDATAEIPAPMLGVAVPIDLVDTAEALHDQVYCQKHKR